MVETTNFLTQTFIGRSRFLILYKFYSLSYIFDCRKRKVKGMHTKMSFIFVYWILIGFVCSKLLSRGNANLNQQSINDFWENPSMLFNEINGERWDREITAVNPLANGGKCGTKEMSALNKIVLCKPRPYLVKIEVPEGFTMVHPGYVEVMRCDHGKCPQHLAQHCLPGEKQLRRVSVLAFKQGERARCLTLEVEEHGNCKCACLITEKDCQQVQIYSKNNCRCECPNKSEAHACEQNGFNWHSPSCRCIQG